MHAFARFATNVTSQSGEDGIVAEIFRRIGVTTRTCVEFGAWDGKYLSNTWALWNGQSWRAILIEGDAKRHALLEASLTGRPEVQAVCAYVQPHGQDSLDRILERCGLEPAFDLLSIDVDGDDYHIWKGMTRYRARVVVIEYNPTIPPELELVQRPGGYFGASAAALVSLAEANGYRLACCTKTNCIFVDGGCWEKLGIPQAALPDLFPREHLTYVINSYDGKTYLNRTPTYTQALPEATPLNAWRELRLWLWPEAARAESPVESPSRVAPVRIFATPAAGSESAAARLLKSAWRAFRRTRLGAPAGRLRDRWTRWRHGAASLAAWEREGRPVPPPHAHKQRVVCEYASRHGLRAFVETGTYLGDMVEAVRSKFGEVYSIELDPALHRRAAERFAAKRNVRIVLGDSGKILPEVLASVSAPALFWLDGHYSADITAKGDKDTPIASELASIARHPVKGHVILIDDARCFNGSNDYPTIDELKSMASAYWPGAGFEVRDDIVRIAPR